MRRAIALEGTGLPDLELGKITRLNHMGGKDGLGRIYLEEMKDGRWRLTYTAGTIPDLSQLDALRIVREP